MDLVCSKNFVIANKKIDSFPQNSPTVQFDTNVTDPGSSTISICPIFVICELLDRHYRRLLIELKGKT